MKINPGVLVQVHDVHSASHVLSFSEIPLPERSPGREVVRRVLQSRGQWSADVAAALGEGTEAAIDVFSVLATPYEPVVFDSLMKPIASEWGARSTTPDTRAEFWRWRRARSLTEALPISPAIRRAMVRGWFTARILDQIRLAPLTAQIWVPDQVGGGGRFRSFPDPLLTTDVVHRREMLPVVLQSILLALVEVNTRASREPLVPYLRLRELGRSGLGGGYEAYENPATELRDWIVGEPGAAYDGVTAAPGACRRAAPARAPEASAPTPGAGPARPRARAAAAPASGPRRSPTPAPRVRSPGSGRSRPSSTGCTPTTRGTSPAWRHARTVRRAAVLRPAPRHPRRPHRPAAGGGHIEDDAEDRW